MQSSYSIEFNVLVERSDTSWDVYLRADDYLDCILRLLSEGSYYKDCDY